MFAKTIKFRLRLNRYVQALNKDKVDLYEGLAEMEH